MTISHKACRVRSSLVLFSKINYGAVSVEKAKYMYLSTVYNGKSPGYHTVSNIVDNRHTLMQ